MCFVWGHRKFYISASNASATVSSRSRAEASAGNFLPQATADAVGCLSVSLGQSRIIRLLVGSVARVVPQSLRFLRPLKTVKAPSSPRNEPDGSRRRPVRRSHQLGTAAQRPPPVSSSEHLPSPAPRPQSLSRISGPPHRTSGTGDWDPSQSGQLR